MQYENDITYEEAMKGKPREKPSDKFTKTAYKIIEVIKMMKDYNTFSAEELGNKIQEDGDRDKLLKWRSIVTAPNFKTVLAQAVKKQEKIDGDTYLTKFINQCPAKENVLTVRQTQALFGRWCREQNIKRVSLYFNVLTCYCTKGLVIFTRPDF